MSGKKKDDSVGRDAVTRGVAHLAQGQTQNLEKAIANYGETLARSVRTNAGAISEQSVAIQQGFLAEAHHAASFNINAAANGVDNVNASLDSISAIDPKVDIRIHESNGLNTDCQVKYYRDGESTAKAVTEQRYNDVIKVVPKEQLDSVKEEAKKQAARNQDIRPDVSKNYKNTQSNADDRIRSKTNKKIESDPVARKGKGGTEELVEKAKKGKKIEPANKTEAEKNLQSLQYKQAAKMGAMSGAVMEGGVELYKVLSSDKLMTLKECEEVAIASLKGAAKGAGKALATTAVQHAGKAIAKHAAGEGMKSIGRGLTKGNVASNIVILGTSLAKGIYAYQQGEIDGAELVEQLAGESLKVAAGAGGFAGGLTMAPVIGALIPEAISGYAVLGTTMGALGPVALGVVGSIVTTMVITAYIDHFKGQGENTVANEIQRDMATLRGGSMSLAMYTGRIATMTELKFNWTDIVPFTGALSVYGEYKARRNELNRLESEMQSNLNDMPKMESQAKEHNYLQFKVAFAEVEKRYQNEIKAANSQVEGHFDNLNEELSTYLELRFLLGKAARIKGTDVIAGKELSVKDSSDNKARLKSYRDELNSLVKDLEVKSSIEDRELMEQLIITVKARIHNIIPKITPYDIAENYFSGGTALFSTTVACTK